MTVKTTHARFNNAGSVLVVSLKKGKKAIQISVKRRISGEKAATGCRETFTLEQTAEAQASYDKLVAAAKSKGWTEAPRVQKSAFSEIPAPPVVKTEEKPAETPAAPAPAAAPTPKKK
jgi:hypothetical protein